MAHEIHEDQEGFYTLCVFGAENCTDDEINKIFGRFGDIGRTHRNNKLLFIRYLARDDAVACYESMQGDNRFSVNPGRKKGGPNTNTGDIDRKVSDMNRNDNFRGRGSGDFGRPAPKQSPPKLIPFPSVNKEEGATKPPPSAKVVVIGNLNPKLGQNNVYDLCAKAQARPLHVAMKTLKRPPYPNICYAYVYLRDDQEVNSVVTALNDLKLNDYRMIVCSTEKLAEEGKALLSAK